MLLYLNTGKNLKKKIKFIITYLLHAVFLQYFTNEKFKNKFRFRLKVLN